ncbi:hypothetical protein SCARD494_01872 [Seiridium cardinale]
MSKVDRPSADEHLAPELPRRDSNLRLISSPVATGLSEEGAQRVQSMGLTSSGQPDVEHLGFRYKDDDDCPEFVKHSKSTNYELFYDLWFVANLEVFSSSKAVSNESDLYAYVGYLSILWFTWFLVGMFDVRFVTDSILERIIRTAQLGVMVGFSVVVTNFDPEDQQVAPFQTLSLILMVSRLVLFFQYGTIIWHIRQFRKGKLPVAIAAAVHFISAMIFLGIRFRFEPDRNSRVYIVWYIVSTCEALIQLGLALHYKVLTFSKTHLTERMTVLTIIIIGTGVTSIAKNVVLIVNNAGGWTSATIGVLTSAIATMYFFFMIYFDFMSHHHLSGWRQLTWTIFHFPFHVALLLFMEGATQFMVWWRVHEVETDAGHQFNSLIERLSGTDVTITSNLISDELNKTIASIWETYTPTYTLTFERVDSLLLDIRSIPESFWASGANEYPDIANEWAYDIDELIYAVVNSLFVNFKIDPFDGMEEDDPAKMQDVAINDLNERYYTVFQYAYVTAGMVLMFMVIMYSFTKKSGWTPFIIFRTTLFGLMGLGLALVELISKNDERRLNYLLTPWLLPTICIVFFVVLLLSHLPHPPPLFFKRRNSGPRSNLHSTVYTSVQVREVGPDATNAYDNQGYDPRRWGSGAPANVYMQYPTPETTYHNAYGQTGDYGMGSPPPEHN